MKGDVMKFNRLTGFLIGTSVGASIMLLFAPKSGKATRRYLGHRLDDGREVVERGVARFQDTRRDLQHTADQTFSRVRKAAAI
jgi:gas vesicle protein